ncbi:MAG: SRPBCC domain-containing protein [Desulfitobacteriaceae bacterium]
MIQISVVIDRSVKEVWNYFTTPSNWLDWYGGELKDVEPDWSEGAYLVWGLGGKSQIIACVENKELTSCGNAFDTTYQFTARGKKTQMTVIESDPKGGGFFSDGGVAHRAELTKCMNRLKEQVERQPHIGSDTNYGFLGLLKNIFK